MINCIFMNVLQNVNLHNFSKTPSERRPFMRKTISSDQDTLKNKPLALKTKLQEAKNLVNFTNLMIFV